MMVPMQTAERSEPRPLSLARPDSLQTDGCWCPMAHCNRTDDSFQQLPPLRSVKHFQRIRHPVASSKGFIHLGSFTGRSMAVCTYSSPDLPALAAFDYQSGSVLWTSPMEDLQGWPLRIPGGIVMASMGIGGKPASSYVFAANRNEFVAYDAHGGRLWKRRSDEIVPGMPRSIGLPISLSFNDSREVIAATNGGWIVKLSPLDGHTIDTYKMETTVCLDGRLYRGTFFTCKSPIVVGDILYLLAEFKPDDSNPLPWLFSPVHIIRIALTQPTTPGQAHKIKPLAEVRSGKESTPDRIFVGLNRGRGSPPAWVTTDGKVRIFAHAHSFKNGRLYPTIAAVEDDRGVLKQRWLSMLIVSRGDSVHSAPALHGPSGNLFVTTLKSIFLYRDVDQLVGDVPSPQPLESSDMISLAARPGVARVGVGSPFALTYDEESREIVAYTNFRAISTGGRSYGVLGAFSIPAFGRGKPRPLWHRPLAVTPRGRVAPGLGTLGQPALFRYQGDKGMATGLIVNTVFTGTYIIK
jgi:hypothetical protein